MANLDACEDEESGKLMVYLSWKNGQKTQHPTNVIYQRCPQKVCWMTWLRCRLWKLTALQMLQFYERHVRIIKRDPDSDSVGASS